MDKFDVIVLGGGPGGYVAAIRAAQLGAKTAIIEKDGAFGGTCLNRGCIPTKTFVKNAEIIQHIENAQQRGISAGVPKLDINKMVEFKDSVVKQLSGGIEALLKANGVATYKGMGKATDHKTVIIENNDKTVEIEYTKLIIATGSENAIPPIPGVDGDVLTSTELLNIKEIPESLAIIGGGVIGCEFATIFQALGSKVTVIEMLPRLIANLDQGLSAQLKKNFKRKKIDVLLNHGVKELKQTDRGYVVTMLDQATDRTVKLVAEKVLISTGREPNMEGLEALNLELEGKYLKVDDKLRTSDKDIYGIGDITGKIQLAHVASAQGMAAAENAVKGDEKECPLDVVPSCIYTIPEIGSVGMTEEAAREKYGDNLMIGTFPVAALGKALAMGEGEGSFKVIAEKNTGKLLGAHIFGANATDLIMEAAVILQAGGTLRMIGDTIHAHPTMAEGMMEAAHDAEAICIHLPPKKKK